MRFCRESDKSRVGQTTKMAAPSVTLTGRDGKTREFCEPFQVESHSAPLAALHNSISKLQKVTNDALTVLVKEEKAENESTPSSIGKDRESNQLAF
jgi:hypothetical protein